MGSIGLIPRTLRYKGLFDFDGMYAAMVDWAKNHGYKWHEKTYKHKVPGPEGAEQELAWEFTKDVTEYIKYTIKISAHIWELRDVEVKEGDITKILSNARLYMVLDGTVDYDWQGKYNGGGRFTPFLGKWLLKLVKNDEIGGVYWDQLNYRLWDLHAIIKKYFDMQSKKYAYKGYLGEN